MCKDAFARLRERAFSVWGDGGNFTRFSRNLAGAVIFAQPEARMFVNSSWSIIEAAGRGRDRSQCEI